MQEFLNKIKKYFSTKKTFYKKPLNPHKHWAVILYTFFICIIALVIFSLFLLYEIKNDKFFQVEKKEIVNTNVLNQKLFDKVTKDFEHKAQRIEELKTNTSGISDPSL